jgi:hypothetical protein
MAEREVSETDCDRDTARGKCGAPASVFFLIGGGEIPRCSAHADEMREIFQRTIKAGYWSETAAGDDQEAGQYLETTHRR